MHPLVLHFAAGDSLFTGALLVLTTLCLRWRGPLRKRLRTLRTLHGCGWIVIALSATPLPWLVYGAWLGVDLLAWRGRNGSIPAASPASPSRQPRLPVIAMMFAGTILIVGDELRTIVGETDWHGRFEQIVVIGDSLSAGAGEATPPWPVQLKQRGYPVTNLARAGATTGTAREQAARIPNTDESVLVIVEIGGNDMLSGRSAAEFRADLQQLLATLRRPGRTIVVFELPLLPGANGYGAAQRELCRGASVSLISKRVLAQALSGSGQTIDGLHLSETGHQSLAEWFSARLGVRE